MLSKILGLKKNDKPDKDEELAEKISKMNLTEMRSYLNNRIPTLEVSKNGLVEILKKLTTLNEKSSKRYIEIDDMDSKKKSGFDIVIHIATQKKISVKAVELVEKFIVMYDDVIKKYDTENKQIYGSKLNDSLQKAISNMNEISEIKKKLNFLNKK